MKYAICNEIFQGWTIEAAMEFSAKTGYDGIEIAPFTLAPRVTEISAVRRREIRDMAGRIGIEIIGIHWVLVNTEGYHLTHPDEATRTRTKKYFCELVDFCADIGGRIIVLGSPRQRNILPEVTAEQAWDFATGTLREPVARAVERGVTICLEPLSPGETNFINTAAEAIRFVGQFESPAMKIILDVKAMCSEAKPIPQIIRESQPHFAHFHANDKNLKGPGFGDTDFKPIAAALKEVGYDGYASVEVFKFEEGPEEIARRSLETLKAAFTSAAK